MKISILTNVKRITFSFVFKLLKIMKPLIYNLFFRVSPECTIDYTLGHGSTVTSLDSYTCLKNTLDTTFNLVDLSL